MKFVFVTNHAANQKRKTGFHFWANILTGHGHNVFFITVGSSKLHKAMRGKQYDCATNIWEKTSPHIYQLGLYQITRKSVIRYGHEKE